MLKKYYFHFNGPLTIYEIAEQIGAKISDEQANFSKEKLIFDIKNIEDAEEGDLAFISNKKYHNILKEASCSACIVDQSFNPQEANENLILLKTEDPYFAYSKALKLLFTEKFSTSRELISPLAKIDKDISLGTNVVIEDNVEIGAGTIIEHNAVIKQGVKIGRNSRIGAGSYIAYAQLGNNVIIHSGVRIGNDGFGFATYKGVHHKILHVGGVIIGDNVEIGANSAIDRGSNKDTMIGSNTIIDNLVQIGHNVEIGKGCIIVSQVGIAGSTKLGDYVAVGGQAGIAGHLKIANFTQIAAKAGVMNNLDKEGQIVGGFPSQPIRDWHKQTILLRKMLNDSK